MALIELAKVIAEDPSASRRWAAEPLPLTDRLTAVLASRFAALPGQTQAALLLAAVADGPDLNAAASHGAGPDARALAPAEQLGLIKVHRTGLRFSHPLVRSAIYHSAPFAQRAAASRARERLARSPDRRAWHLAAAALQPDEDVASLLGPPQPRRNTVAARLAAALAMERAAELSPDPEDQARRLVAAASAAVPPARVTGCRISPPGPSRSRRTRTAADRPPRCRVGAGLVGGAPLRCRRSSPSPKRRHVTCRPSPGTRSGVRLLSPTSPDARQPQAVSHALGLLERQGPPPPSGPRALMSTC